jgi:hypothetical protein
MEENHQFFLPRPVPRLFEDRGSKSNRFQKDVVRASFHVSSERFLEMSILQLSLYRDDYSFHISHDVPLRQPSHHRDPSFWLGGAVPGGRGRRTPANGYHSFCRAPRPVHRTTSSRRDLSSPATLLHPLCGRPNFRDAVI